MKRKLFFCLIFILVDISVYSINLTSLDKYKWIEQVLETTGKTTKFEKIGVIPTDYEIYKMKYYQKGSSYVNFFIFYYNPNDNTYYDVADSSYKKSKIPLSSFKGLEYYTKINDNDSTLEGEYYSTSDKIFHLEIKKVEKRNYVYTISLTYEELGTHFLYLENNILKSDNTFGLCNEKSLEDLFSVDRSESYYNYRNILSTYSNDSFTINITKNEEYDIELELTTDIRTVKIIPQPLYINNYVYLYQNAEIFDDDFNFVRNQNSNKEKVQIVDKKNEWFERNGLLTLFLKVKFSDGSTGWIYSDQFRLF